MNKQYFILIILLLAFSLGLAHNIIPHHHHDEVSEAKPHKHDHEHHHGTKSQEHYHDGVSETKSNNRHDEHHHHDEPLGFFSHISHIIATNEFSFISDEYDFQKVEVSTQPFEGVAFISRKREIQTKSASESAHYVVIAVRQSVYPSLFLRGPPTLFV